MIELNQLVKKFDTTPVLDGVDLTIPTGTAFGLLGSNGAGKSTILRLISGIYRPEGGELLVDGQPAYDNVLTKQRIFFINDETVQFTSYTLEELKNFYKPYYPSFSEEAFEKLRANIKLPLKKKLSTFSKGMKRQAIVIIALACRTDYLLLDEAFDGLDPVIRLMVKKLLAEEIAERGATVVISSHNLRELEDLCDQVGLLSAGRLLFEKDLDALKLGFCRVQAAYDHPVDWEATGLAILDKKERGKLVSLLVRGTAEETLAVLEAQRPLFAEALPMTLEEVFIGEMEAAGYDYSNILS